MAEGILRHRQELAVAECRSMPRALTCGFRSRIGDTAIDGGWWTSMATTRLIFAEQWGNRRAVAVFFGARSRMEPRGSLEITRLRCRTGVMGVNASWRTPMAMYPAPTSARAHASLRIFRRCPRLRLPTLRTGSLLKHDLSFDVHFLVRGNRIRQTYLEQTAVSAANHPLVLHSATNAWRAVCQATPRLKGSRLA